MGSDANTGFYRTLAVYNSESHKISYGDSLGWELPQGLLQHISRYVQCVYKLNNPEIHIMHDPSLK